MAHYVIQSHITVKVNGWESSRQVPSFILDSEIQGIVDAAHAGRIAVSILATCFIPNSGFESISVGAYNSETHEFATVKKVFGE